MNLLKFVLFVGLGVSLRWPFFIGLVNSGDR